MSRLPGDIGGLLRRGSPTLDGVVIALGVDGVGEHYAMVANTETETVYCEPLADIALDLTDATGRAHAAWWALVQPDWLDRVWEFGEYTRGQFCEAVTAAQRRADMTTDQIETLRRLVLRLAGRTNEEE